MLSAWHVLLASFATAIATGLGVIPFIFNRSPSTNFLGIGYALAAGLMLGASIALGVEGIPMGPVNFALGLIAGIIVFIFSRKLLGHVHKSQHDLESQSLRQKIIFIGVMTVHSFAEGIGVGVSFGEGQGFGNLISLAIAIHNIPEGLAVALVLIPKGSSIRRAALWAVFTSLPQPIMAVPAFLFVHHFKEFLPFGFGFAAGAMLWMIVTEIWKECRENLKLLATLWWMGVSALLMLLFQLCTI